MDGGEVAKTKEIIGRERTDFGRFEGGQVMIRLREGNATLETANKTQAGVGGLIDHGKEKQDA